MNEIKLQAYAKINLSLDVVGRRENGYHDITSFMQDIGICDKVTVSTKPQKNPDYSCVIGNIRVEFCIDNRTIPTDRGNLGVRGAEAVLEAMPVQNRNSAEVYSVEIEKLLPIAAGIAGGSGNAAAAMLGVNAIAGYPFSLRELMDMGAKIGADIPFSLMMNAKKNSEALAELPGIEEASIAANIEGIGEIVEPTDPIHRYVILMNPGIAVSTKEVYEEIDALPERVREPKQLFYNIMEEYTLKHYDEAAALSKAMREHLHADEILMSGSGPTIAAYYLDREQAEADFRGLETDGWMREGWRAWYTESGGDR